MAVGPPVFVSRWVDVAVWYNEAVISSPQDMDVSVCDKTFTPAAMGLLSVAAVVVDSLIAELKVVSVFDKVLVCTVERTDSLAMPFKPLVVDVVNDVSSTVVLGKPLSVIAWSCARPSDSREVITVQYRRRQPG